jgi:hypothetical protein
VFFLGPCFTYDEAGKWMWDLTYFPFFLAWIDHAWQ